MFSKCLLACFYRVDAGDVISIYIVKAQHLTEGKKKPTTLGMKSLRRIKGSLFMHFMW